MTPDPHPGPRTRTRVVVDGLSARFGGGLSYLTRQLEALTRVAPDLDLTVLVDPANAPVLGALPGVRTRTVRTGRLRPVWELAVLPLLGRPDEVLSCPGTFSPLLPGRRAVVVTVQNPNFFGQGRRQPHNRSIDRRVRIALAQASVRRADVVVAISEALRDEILLDLPHLADRVVVITSGAPVWPAEARRPPTLPRTVDRFILSLANDAPHKHVDDTVAAWDAARARDPSGPALVLAGRSFDPDRPHALRRLVDPDRRASLVQLGAVTDRREVRWLLEHADAMVSSSSLEAHPLTPAEAGSLGCPLVLTDIPSHREVAGTHARYVPPGDRAALAEALLEVRPRAETDADARWTWPVTWDDNARALAEVLRQAPSRRRGSSSLR